MIRPYLDTATAAGFRRVSTGRRAWWVHPDCPGVAWTHAALVEHLDATTPGPLSVRCPTCQSLPGQQCRTSHGRRLPRHKPHQARLRQWVAL